MSDPLPVFKIERHFNVPVALMFECWTKAEHFTHWFSPKGFSSQIIHSDLEIGGYHHVAISSPDGMTMYGKLRFLELSAPNRLVYVNAFLDSEGNLVRHPFVSEWPIELLTTVSLESSGQGTDLTLTWEPIDASSSEINCFANGLDGCTVGWTGTFDLLDEYSSHLQLNSW